MRTTDINRISRVCIPVLMIILSIDTTPIQKFVIWVVGSFFVTLVTKRDPPEVPPLDFLTYVVIRIQNGNMKLLTVPQLKRACRILNMKGFSRLNKKELWQKIEEAFPLNQGNQECPICFNDKTVLYALKPCNHGICLTCGSKVRKCPFCRVRVTQSVCSIVDDL